VCVCVSACLSLCLSVYLSFCMSVDQPGVPAVTVPQSAAALQVLKQRADEIGVRPSLSYRARLYYYYVVRMFQVSFCFHDFYPVPSAQKLFHCL